MEPIHQQLVELGYAIQWISGAYCAAWRGQQEVLLHWKNGVWILL